MGEIMKRILKPIGLGALLGFVLLAIQILFDIPDHVFNKIVIIVFVLVIVLIIGINIIFVQKYQRRVHKQIALLEAGKQKEALFDMQQMLETAQRKKMVNVERICRLNMTAALCDLKEYQQALNILEGMDPSTLKGQEEFVYDLNLCACYFYLEKYEEGLDVYDRSYTVFEKFKDNPVYGGYVAVVTIWAMLALGEYNQAELMLASTKEKWNVNRLYEDYRMIEMRLGKKKSDEKYGKE